MNETAQLSVTASAASAPAPVALGARQAAAGGARGNGLNALQAILDNAMGGGRSSRSRGTGSVAGGGAGGEKVTRKGGEGTHEDGTKPAALFAAMVVYSASIVLM